MSAHWWRASERKAHDFARHLSTPKPPKPPPAVTPIVDTTAADEAAAKENAARRRKRGRASTILTSPVGAGLGESMTGGSPTLGGGLSA
jgi:hypothetical protein